MRRFSSLMEIQISTCMVFPVSGVIPSIVRTTSNCIFEVKSRADISQRGDSSSILWDTIVGQNIWKKSCVPSISVPKSMLPNGKGLPVEKRAVYDNKK